VSLFAKFATKNVYKYGVTGDRNIFGTTEWDADCPSNTKMLFFYRNIGESHKKSNKLK
jgi:hypothetical protein